MITSILISLFFIGLFFVLIVGAIILQLIRMLSGEAPFVSTEACARQTIVDILPLRKSSIVYDLGCGNAKVLIACHQKEPDARYIGIEKNIIPYCLARWNLFRYDHPGSILLLRENIFSVDYREATRSMPISSRISLIGSCRSLKRNYDQERSSSLRLSDFLEKIRPRPYS